MNNNRNGFPSPRYASVTPHPADLVIGLWTPRPRPVQGKTGLTEALVLRVLKDRREARDAGQAAIRAAVLTAFRIAA